MGTVGLASYQFSYLDADFMPRVGARGGVALPSGGDVEATASVAATTRRDIAVEGIPAVPRDAAGPGLDVSQGQIDVLQREVVGLRRRLSALSEQNLAYSRRIAALERQVAVARLSGASVPASSKDTTAEPGPGVVITTAAPQQPPTATEVPQSAASPTETAAKSQDAPVGVAAEAATGTQPRTTTPRLISLYRTDGDTATSSAGPIDPKEPVRIVRQSPAVLPVIDLPEPSAAPLTTGSIPTLTEATLPDAFDATPTQTTARPKIIEPSAPAGRLRGGGDIQLKRSDFGAIIGHYRTNAAAAKAWADFKTQNAERMRDLRPLLMQRQTEEGGVALMVGPFANAADAAVACLHLLDVTELCHPALYAGDPLVTAAKFRDSAF